VNGGADQDEFHPMKGPMTTQTLRGLQNSGGMHWRGDRTDGFFGLDSPYLNGGSADAGDEQLNFDNFIVAFPGLLGGATPPTDPQLQDDMAAFTDFALELMLPPNPIANLDGTLTPAQSAGATLYGGRNTDIITNCNGCHTLAPENGYFGTGGLASFEGEPQTFKVPHLRNAYQKVGMFGVPGTGFVGGGTVHRGDQIRGFGYLHDGSVDTLFSFLSVGLFQLNDTEQRDMEQFMLAFPSDLAPVVGQQVTDTGAVNGDVTLRIALFRQRAAAAFTSKVLGGTVTECDLVVTGSNASQPRGWLFQPGSGTYLPNRAGDPAVSQAALDAIADGGQPLTYTCAPPGSGVRMALDRDLDGARDGDERDAFTDPANPGSIVGACNDGIDNDGDGQADLADPSCTSASLKIENPQCRNGVDDDGDGLVDAADPHCSGPSDDRERAGSSCGLGTELALLLGGWWLARGRRARRSVALR